MHSIFSIPSGNFPFVWASIPQRLTLPASNVAVGCIFNFDFSILYVLHGNRELIIWNTTLDVSFSCRTFLSPEKFLREAFTKLFGCCSLYLASQFYEKPVVRWTSGSNIRPSQPTMSIRDTNVNDWYLDMRALWYVFIITTDMWDSMWLPPLSSSYLNYLRCCHQRSDMVLVALLLSPTLIHGYTSNQICSQEVFTNLICFLFWNKILHYHSLSLCVKNH